MMKLKTRPITVATEGQPALVEPWPDWQIRTMSAAGQAIRKTSLVFVTSWPKKGALGLSILGALVLAPGKSIW